MGCFDSDRELYDHVGRLIVELLADEDLGPRFCQANTVVRCEHRDLGAAITVSLHDGEQPVVEFGDGGELEPEVTMRMDADAAHRFWLGEVNLAVALTRGEIEAGGPVHKLLWLAPLTARAIPRYRELLRSQGREDLVTV